MKKLLVTTAAIAALAIPAAASAGNGSDFKKCFGVSYGQTGLQYGQFKKDPAHAVGGGYGITGVLAAHGPNGAIPLVPSNCAD